MRFQKKCEHDSILYNTKKVVSNIPAKTYDYVVTGQSAVEWIRKGYQISTHKDSGIKNDLKTELKK